MKLVTLELCDIIVGGYPKLCVFIDVTSTNQNSQLIHSQLKFKTKVALKMDNLKNNMRQSLLSYK